MDSQDARQTTGGGKSSLRGAVALPREVRAFWVASLVAIGLTLLVSLLEAQAGMQKLRWDPLSDPFMGDLMEYPGTYQLLHTRAFFSEHVPGGWPSPLFNAVAYPPFSAVLLVPIYLSGQPVLVYLAIAAVFLLVLLVGVQRALVKRGVDGSTAWLLPLSLMVISFPIERLVHQGNVELVLWVFTVAGTYAFLRGRDNAAALLWGLAAAMKLYPVFLLLLLLPRRKYGSFLLGGATFLGVSWLSLWWLGPTVKVAWRGSLHNVFGYQGMRTSEWSLRELVANHSAFEPVKLGAMIAGLPLGKLSLPYYACGAAVLAWAFWRRLWKMPMANQLLAVSLFMVMLPTVSYYHTLVHLYAPLLLLVFMALRAQREGVEVPGLRMTMLLFVPLFVPFTLLTFPTKFLFCGLLQALVLMVLFVRSLEYPMEVDVANLLGDVCKP